MLKASSTKIQSTEIISKDWEEQFEGRRELDEISGY